MQNDLGSIVTFCKIINANLKTTEQPETMGFVYLSASPPFSHLTRDYCFHMAHSGALSVMIEHKVTLHK